MGSARIFLSLKNILFNANFPFTIILSNKIKKSIKYPLVLLLLLPKRACCLPGLLHAWPTDSVKQSLAAHIPVPLTADMICQESNKTISTKFLYEGESL